MPSRASANTSPRTRTGISRHSAVPAMSPRRLASIAAAMPTDEVPPRMSRLWPGWMSRPMVREPCAVCGSSGMAPMTGTRGNVTSRGKSQARFERWGVAGAWGGT